MAFNKYNLTINTKGRNSENRFINYKSSTDNLATIKTSGYFNDAQDSSPLKIGDLIAVTGSNGSTTLRVATISPNVVTDEFGIAS